MGDVMISGIIIGVRISSKSREDVDEKIRFLWLKLIGCGCWLNMDNKE